MTDTNHEATPNIFSFATSELSQDAAFAYFLQWAEPRYKGNAKMHALGVDFLTAVLGAINETEQGVKEIAIPEFESVEVKTQESKMDVTVRINGNLFLIIEDKTGTGAHSDQIKRYKETVRDWVKNEKETWEIVAVYAKTGNEDRSFASKYADGVMYRGAILEVLKRHTDTGDTIVDQFRQHLQDWEDCTNSWKTWKFKGERMWGKAAEGYYLELQKDEGVKKEHNIWHFTNNPGGGFLEFGFGGDYTDPDNKQGLVGQIQDATELRLHSYGGFTSDELWGFLNEAEQLAKKYSNMKVNKAPQIRGGRNSGSFAVVSFDREDTYLALRGDGTIDFDATVERLKLVGELLGELVKEFGKKD